MTKNVQNVRQSTAVGSVFIGLLGQFIQDLGLNTIRVHDGATAGGFPLLGAANNLSDLVTPATARTNLDVYSKAESRALAATAYGLLFGCTLSNNAGTPNTKMDISAGFAADSSNTVVMTAAAGTVDCTTTGANGMDTGGMPTSGEVHFFVIMKADLTQALLGSISVTPSLPSGYSYYRRVGSITSDASAHFDTFIQDGDYFHRVAATFDYLSQTPGSGWALKTLHVPAGIRVRPLAWAQFASTANCNWSFSNGDYTPSGNYPVMALTVNAGDTMCLGTSDFWTDTSKRINMLASSTSSTYSLFSRGWIDPRGRLS